VVGATFLVVFSLTATDARVQLAAGGPGTQLMFIIREPLGFLGILWSNLQNSLLTWTFESIGALGWLKIAMPPAFYLFVLVAGLVLVVRGGEIVSLQPWRRALLAAVGVAVFLTLAIALYAFLEPTGSGRVFFQGRYLAPVWLLLLSVCGIKFAERYRGILIIVGVSLVIIAQNLVTLMSYYHP
jgi:uncharacterized membrane protein